MMKNKLIVFLVAAMIIIVLGVWKIRKFQLLLAAVPALLPVFFGAGPVVLVGAVLGGAYFLRKTHALARTPSRTTAMASFFASMVQLSALLAAVAIDAALR